VSNSLNFTILVAPSTVAGAVAYVAESSPLEYGIVGLVLAVGMFPITKWMMTRLTTSQKAEIARADRQETRSDKQLTVLISMAAAIRRMNQDHNEDVEARKDAVTQLLDLLDGLPDRIAKNCKKL